MIKTFSELFTAHCRPLEGGKAMKHDEVRAQLVELPDWRSDGKRIQRGYKFADYWHTIAFVNVLAYVIHREDHHPELVVGYNTLEVRFDTHSVDGISMNDFICAAKCDALYAERPKKANAV